MFRISNPSANLEKVPLLATCPRAMGYGCVILTLSLCTESRLRELLDKDYSLGYPKRTMTGD
nr:hypothetical protein Itr_chr08CG11490 [Ipomoea trifida]